MSSKEISSYQKDIVMPSNNSSSNNNNNNNNNRRGGLQEMHKHHENPLQDDADADVVFDNDDEQSFSDNSSSHRWDDRKYYNWRNFWQGGSILQFFRWLFVGYNDSVTQETDDHINYNLRKMAHLLTLLREYYETYGMPTDGGPKDKEFVLSEVTKDLYAGGAPIWTLESAMERAAEGLTGKKGVDFFILPRKAFIFAPTSGATTMFRLVRGFDICKLTNAERILVRICSYASNTHGVSSLPSRLPEQRELLHAYRAEQMSGFHSTKQLTIPTKDEMAKKILELSCRAEGFFYFINSKDRPDTKVVAINNMLQHDDSDGITSEAKEIEVGSSENDKCVRFWKIEDDIAELFSRLATIDAITKIDEMDKKRHELYPSWMLSIFRFMTSAGACGFWFNGGWIDMGVAGCCGALVGLVSSWSILSKEERIIFEAVASLLIGIVAGLVSLYLPEQTCFGAMGVAGVIDLLQGFRVVYAVIELMSKHTVSGGADFMEGLLYTGLIAYFLKLGEVIAEYLTGKEGISNNEHLKCSNNIDELWYILLVPLASLAWSGLFNPKYKDLPFMCLHGVLAYVVSWVCTQANVDSDFSLFIAAMCVTFSSGLVSRFTGRQAMGNTVSGLYVLLPGAYLVNSLFNTLSLDFLGKVFFNAAIIGTGAWSGTILCSPTVLGTTAGLLRKQSGSGRAAAAGRQDRTTGTGAMLFF